MRTIITVFLLLLSITVCANSAVTKITIEKWQTKNGAQVYFVHSPIIPIVDIQIVFAAGSAYDGKYWGLGSFTNALLGEGTQHHNADQISKIFDNMGAQFSQDVNQDIAAIRLRSLTTPKYLNPALVMFREVLTQAKFPRDAIARIRQQTVAEIKMGEQTPGVIAMEAFYRLIYADHPYAHPIDGGSVTRIEAITEEGIKKFYQRYYVAKNADVIMVGDITRAAAEAMAEKIIGGLPAGQPPSSLSMAENTQKAAYQFVAFPAKQDNIIIGQIGVPAGDPNRFPLVVGNEILGGAPLSSILFNEVRSKRGLAYQVSSQFSPLKYRGTFYIQLQSRTDQAKSALQVSQQMLRSFIQNGPTVEQLNAAKKNMMGNFPLQISSNAGILDVVTIMAFYKLPLDYLNTYIQKMQMVTAASVKETFQKIVHVNAMKIVVVGAHDPTAKLQMSQKNDEG